MNASTDPGLYSAMMAAKKIFTPMTQEQIDMKTREVRKELAARGRR